MRKAAVSLVALVLMLGAFALPGTAAPRDFTSAKGTNYEISMSGIPDAVSVGQTVTARITITIYPGVSQNRRVFTAHQEMLVDSDLNPIGLAHRGGAAVPVGRTKTLTKEFVIPANAPEGRHGLVVSTTVLGETLNIGKFFDINK